MKQPNDAVEALPDGQKKPRPRGRPPVGRSYDVRLSEDLHATALQLGEGKLAEGMRVAVSLCQHLGAANVLWLMAGKPPNKQSLKTLANLRGQLTAAANRATTTAHNLASDSGEPPAAQRETDGSSGERGEPHIANLIVSGNSDSQVGHSESRAQGGNSTVGGNGDGTHQNSWNGQDEPAPDGSNGSNDSTNWGGSAFPHQ